MKNKKLGKMIQDKVVPMLKNPLTWMAVGVCVAAIGLLLVVMKAMIPFTMIVVGVALAAIGWKKRVKDEAMDSAL